MSNNASVIGEPIAGQALSHRQFLRILATAVGAVGVGQLAATPQQAEAADENVTGNLTVTGKAAIGGTDLQSKLTIHTLDSDGWDAGIRINRDWNGTVYSGRIISATDGLLFRYYYAGGITFGFRRSDDYHQLDVYHSTNNLRVNGAVEFSDVNNWVGRQNMNELYVTGNEAVKLCVYGGGGLTPILAVKKDGGVGKVYVNDTLAIDQNAVATSCYYAP